jgi:SNF2-related domain/Helicase conserved C-terminal domain
VSQNTDVLPTDEWTEASISWLDGLALGNDKTGISLKTLVTAQWVKLYRRSHSGSEVVRVCVLPDDVGRRYLDRSNRNARNALKNIMSLVDTAVENFDTGGPTLRDGEAPSNITEDHESLFYVFNTLESPSPDPQKILDADSRGAVMDVLDNDSLHGLKTPLYPYQKRSAAMMIQRECNPSFMLDPRYENLTGPTGQQYYYDGETGNIIREKIQYEEARGGILAETMGYGKTLICLAVILATKGHWPRIPAQYSEIVRTRERTGSLMEMAAARIGISSISWRPRLEQLERQGEHYLKCIDACERNSGIYAIPPPPPRYSGRESKVNAIQEKLIKLCPATLVIVPSNLLVQWQQEIASHTEGLKILEIHRPGDKVPPAEELMKYDIVLMSKSRFEKESPDFNSIIEKSNTPEGLYRSPLMELHWLRIIVDEGHSFALSGSRTNAVHVLDQLHVERRWIVSGTPSNGLMGVEVGLAANETADEVFGSPEGSSQLALDSRKNSIYAKEEIKDLEKLRVIVEDFLKLQPWANSLANDSASWSKYIMPYDKSGHKRKSTTSLRSTLSGLVVRHRIEDVERDLSLPPLHNKVVYLKPSFYDKLSINLFMMVLTSNAVTSERVDQDYMFHPRNRKLLDSTLKNLRESGFWWVGFNFKDLDETLRVIKEYLEKNREITPKSDLDLLQEAMAFGDFAVHHPTWRAFTEFHEVGIFIDDFPEDAREAWAMSSSQTDPLLLGTIEAKLVQKRVNSELALQEDPTEGLVGAGLRAMQDAKKRAAAERSEQRTENTPKLALAPDGTRLKGKRMPVRNKDSSPTKPRNSFSPLKTEGSGANTLVSPTTSKTASKVIVPSDSPVAKTKICGTASAKLTYLIDRVLQYQADEKIIIFYEGNNVAFWIAEALELLGVQFLIYANTLSTARRAIYLATFNQTESFRVLIMDLRQAAHGLHIACASRVFIVNPIWQPSVEAQAIKRAHRIGQTRPVFVETLVLKDTLEDKMLRRRKNMTNQELQQAEKSLLDDNTMSSIIQNEKLIPISEEEKSQYGQIAMLETAQPLFGREGRSGHGNENLVLPEGTPVSTPTLKAKRKIAFDDVDTDSIPILESDVVLESSPSKRKKSVKLKRGPRLDDDLQMDDGSIRMVGPSKSRKPALNPKTKDSKKAVLFADSALGSPSYPQNTPAPLSYRDESSTSTTMDTPPKMKISFHHYSAPPTTPTQPQSLAVRPPYSPPSTNSLFSPLRHLAPHPSSPGSYTNPIASSGASTSLFGGSSSSSSTAINGTGDRDRPAKKSVASTAFEPRGIDKV